MCNTAKLHVCHITLLTYRGLQYTTVIITYNCSAKSLRHNFRCFFYRLILNNKVKIFLANNKQTYVYMFMIRVKSSVKFPILENLVLYLFCNCAFSHSADEGLQDQNILTFEAMIFTKLTNLKRPSVFIQKI